MPLNWNCRGIVKLWSLSLALVGLLLLLAGSRVGRADDVVTPNGTITYTATRTLSGNGLNIATPTFVPPASYSMGKVAGGNYAQLTTNPLDGVTPTFSPNGPEGVGAAIFFTTAQDNQNFLVDLNGILTTGGKGKGGGQITWNANEVVTPTFKIAAGTPQAKPAVVVEKEQTTVKFQVQLYNGPSSNKQPATEVTSQTYTLAPSVSGSGVKIDAVQALEGQTWTIASGGSQAIVTIHGPSKQVSFSVTATVESSKPGIMSVKLSGQVTLASGKTLSAAATPPARFSVAAVQYTEYYDNGSTVLPKTEDKVVEFKRPQQGADLPADRFLKVCKIKLKKPTLVDVNITLKNPTGNLGLFKASVTGLSPTPQGSITLTLPKDGTTAKFKLSGETASTAVNDSKVSAYLNKHNKKNGSASTHDAGDAKFTVFSFGNAKMTLVQGNAYTASSANGSATLTATWPSVKMTSWQADILPTGLAPDWSTNGILKNFQINWVQNCLSGTWGVLYTVDPSTALFDKGTPVGTIGTAPTTITMAVMVSSPLDDCLAALPFYNTGDHEEPANVSGFTPKPFDGDDPTASWITPLTGLPINDATGNQIGTVRYKATTLTLTPVFHDWSVVEDMSNSSANYVLGAEGGWEVDLSGVSVPTTAAGSVKIDSSNGATNDYPVVSGTTANDYIRNSANLKTTDSTTTTSIKATLGNTQQ